MSQIKNEAPITAFAGLSLIAAWAGAAQSNAASEHWDVTMQTARHYMHEQCIEIDKGRRLAYRITTPRPVDFNIHHHSEAGTDFPVKTMIERSLEGELAIPQSGEYCFMWQNPRQTPEAFTVELDYQIFGD